MPKNNFFYSISMELANRLMKGQARQQIWIQCWKLELWSQYFENIWCFTNISFRHKWNEAWLLLINWYIRFASPNTECLKSYDLRKLRKFRIMLKLDGIKTRWNYSPVPSPPPKKENFANTSERLRENRNWSSPALRYFTWKRVLSQIFCSWLSFETAFCF